MVQSLQGIYPNNVLEIHLNLFQQSTFIQDFSLPSESFDLIFLKAKLAILCAKGFEIMDLDESVLLFLQKISHTLTSCIQFQKCDYTSQGRSSLREVGQTL